MPKACVSNAGCSGCRRPALRPPPLPEPGPTAAPSTVAVVLAGGRAQRLGGGDKGRTLLAGRSLFAHVLERLRPQVAAVVLNANGDSDRFADLGLEVVADPLPGHPGPLAGILAGLHWAAGAVPAARWLVSVPADGPFLPRDLVARLQQACDGGAPAAVAACMGRPTPVVGLWPVASADALAHALTIDGIRRVEDWSRRIGAAVVAFPPLPGVLGPLDPFFSVNTPEDLATAQAQTRQ